MKVGTDILQPELSQTYTYADTLNWHFKEYVELIGGRVVVKSTPFTAHQQCLGNLAGELGMFRKRKPCRAYMGPLNVRLGGAMLADS